MKLLLDEMWSSEIAVQLRRRGYAVIAVVELPELRGEPDAAILAAAGAERRVLVTDNVCDFRPLVLSAIHEGRSHFGVVFTTNGRFPRHEKRTTGRIVAALEQLLLQQADLTDQEYWL